MKDDSFNKNFHSLTNKKWSLKKYNEKDVDYITQSHDVSPLVAKLLSIRNVNYKDIQSYINPSLKNSIPDPSTLTDMDIACERIFKAILDEDRISIFGDYDVDGSTSTSILVNYFRQISINLDFHIPDRFTEGYGPSINSFSKFKSQNTNVIITVDCGTMAHSEIAYANQQGMDVIVLDHHLPEISLPEAKAIINPNLSLIHI